MISVKQITDVGRIRKANEDSVLVTKNQSNHKILIMADGMGGHNAGEVASFMACNIISKEFQKTNEDTDYKKFLKKIFLFTNSQIYKESLLNSEYDKMGTTLSVLIYTHDKIYTAHVGDSRIYFVNNEKIIQITKDHTLVQSMIDNGNLSVEEAKVSRYKNILLQAIGTSKEINVELKEIRLPYSYKFILCSDGLTSEVTDKEIFDILNKEEALDNRLKELIDLANKKDGSDNISIICLEREEL